MDAEKLVTPLKYRHVALVVVNGPFPLDALRYDRCYPYKEGDSRAIEQSMNFGEPSQTRHIIICKYSEKAKDPWFVPFWAGQSRVQLYPMSEQQEPELRKAVEDGAAELWINKHLGRRVR